MTNLRLRQFVRRLSVSALLVQSTLGIASGQNVPKARLDAMPRQYTGQRPLVSLVYELIGKFGWTISMEEPPWVLQQGTGPMFRKEVRMAAAKHNSRLNLPEGKLDLTSVFAREYTSAKGLIEACLKAYSAQGNQGGYIVRESNGMLQIIPDPESPAVQITGPSLLDWEIEVPVGSRLPSEHFAALCSAVQEASGVACVDLGYEWSLDRVYLANWPPEKIEWGCSRMKARAALEDFLSHSMTTMKWALLCNPKEGGERVCFLNLGPLQVEVQTSRGRVRKPLSYDRGWRFPYPQITPPLPPDEQ